MFDFSDRVTVPAHVRVTHLAGESALLNVTTEVYFGLDATGTRIWQLATTEPNIESAFNRLAREFEVEPELLRKHLIELLGQLIKHGLIEVTPNECGRPS